tara:strand:- start:1155 stop:1349 length:195 start_codon:yes stop_codon:yes gene_type:complete
MLDTDTHQNVETLDNGLVDENVEHALVGGRKRRRKMARKSRKPRRKSRVRKTRHHRRSRRGRKH